MKLGTELAVAPFVLRQGYRTLDFFQRNTIANALKSANARKLWIRSPAHMLVAQNFIVFNYTLEKQGKPEPSGHMPNHPHLNALRVMKNATIIAECRDVGKLTAWRDLIAGREGTAAQMIVSEITTRLAQLKYGTN